MALILGVDFGAQNIEICKKGEGIILREPNVAAVDTKGNVLAVGTEAILINNRAPGTVTLRRPCSDGVICDYNLTAEVLDRFLEAAAPKVKKHLIVSVRYGLDEKSRHILMKALADCRTGKVLLTDTVTAAYVGIGKGTGETEFGGTVICDIGADNVEAAYLRGGEILRQAASPVGGNAQNRALAAYIKNKYGIAVTEEAVHEIKCSLSLVGSTAEDFEISGIDTATGMPRKILACGGGLQKLYISLTKPVAELIENMLGNLPTHGENHSHADRIILIGGGAKLPGIGEYIGSTIDREVTVWDAPIDAAASGLSIMCDNFG